MNAEQIAKLASLALAPGPTLVQNAPENPGQFGKAVLANAIPGGNAWNLLSAINEKRNADSQKKDQENSLAGYMMAQNAADQGLDAGGALLQEEQMAQDPSAVQMQPMAAMPIGSGGGGISAEYASAFKNLMDAQMRSQQLGEEELKTLKERLENLKAQPENVDPLGRTLATMADIWGEGKGKFTQLYGALNPSMDGKQRAAAIAQLEDTIRKGRGDQSAAEVAMNKAKMSYAADKMALAAKAAGGGAAQLPAGQAAELADLSTVGSQVDNMSNEWVKLFGESRRGDPTDISQTGWMKANIPGTPENIFEASRRQWAQTIGVPLEGGKLTDPDYKRYLDNFIPSATDSVERARAKAQNLKKYAAEKQAQRLKAFSMAGYDTRGFGGGARPAQGIDPNLQAELQRRGLIK